MVKQQIALTHESDIGKAVEQLKNQLKDRKGSSRLVIFLAGSKYDFHDLSMRMKEGFADSQVLGASTSGEISNQGFTKDSILATTLECDDMKLESVLIDNSEGLAILAKDEIEAAYRGCGFTIGRKQKENGFGFMLVTGLKNMEESLLSLIYGIIQNPQFRIAGGSAGDDLAMKETFVSCNGHVTNHGGVIAFIHTNHKIDIRKENIYHQTGRKLVVTDASIEERKIIRINGERAMTAYAKKLGVTEEKAKGLAFSNPLGRIIGDNIFISSIANCNDDGTISMFARVLPGTKVDILSQDDIMKTQKETFEAIKAQIPDPGFIFFINCILRTVAFEQQHCCSELTTLANSYFDSYCGFSSYGEQLNKVNSNQTLITIVIGE